MTVKEILKKHGFRSTVHRVAVLEFFMVSQVAYATVEIEKAFKRKIDRVSVYRILHAFTEAQILCKLVDSSGTVRYVFDKHFGHSHHQPHYKCKTCNDVVELPQLPDAYIKQLRKLNIEQINILAEGTCRQCKSKF